jgi:diguanylate cyclase (GGDEF)-like protein
MELSHLAFNIQVLAIPPVALLLWHLARAVAGRFLVFWTAGWVLLAAALLALRVSISTDPAVHPTLVRLSFATYCCLEYGFGYLLWAGCRNLTTGAPLSRSAWVLAGPLTFGVVAPWIMPTDRVYAFHAPIFGTFFLLALAATRGYRASVVHPSFGIHVLRGCLLILGLLFVHYGPVTYWAVWYNGGVPLPYMLLSPMYDALAEVGLAFGMALIAIERVRDSLEAKNRELADAYEQLAVAARTDPLTGLLNRRALDALMKEWTGAAFSGTVAVIDLNGLKGLNDRHGHAAGDAAIQLVARALKGQFRITDPVFRTGGDEFLVVLEGGRAAEMTGRMVSLDADLKGQRVPDVPTAIDLVVAWGLADFAAPADIPAAIERADKAMYACKSDRKLAGRS